MELFGVEEVYIKRWRRLGILPSLDGPPIRFDKKEIDQWLAEGNLERHRPHVVRAERTKGIWEAT